MSGSERNNDVRYGGVANIYLPLKAGIAKLEAFELLPRTESNSPASPFSIAALSRVNFLVACATQARRARRDDFKTSVGDFAAA